MRILQMYNEGTVVLRHTYAKKRGARCPTVQRTRAPYLWCALPKHVHSRYKDSQLVAPAGMHRECQLCTETPNVLWYSGQRHTIPEHIRRNESALANRTVHEGSQQTDRGSPSCISFCKSKWPKWAALVDCTVTPCTCPKRYYDPRLQYRTSRNWRWNERVKSPTDQYTMSVRPNVTRAFSTRTADVDVPCNDHWPTPSAGRESQNHSRAEHTHRLPGELRPAPTLAGIPMG